MILTTLVEILPAIVGLLLYKYYKDTQVKYFIWFLTYLTICDFISNYYLLIKNDGILSFLKNTVISGTWWWVTLFWDIGAILFFSFYYQKVLNTSIFKSIIKYSSIVFLVFSVGYIFMNWEAFFIMFFPIISILGAIIIFMCSIFYFIEILLSDKILTFYKSINFYISFTIFIWWLITTPILFFEIYGSNNDLEFRATRNMLYLMANIFMYLTFTFALLWCKPQND
nr:hypothetical protein [Aestuariibaculum lutulentum]